MLISLVEIKKDSFGSYRLESVYINPKHVIMLREDTAFENDLHEGKINLSINKSAKFTKLTIYADVSKEITVVGSPELIESKFFAKNKMLLKD